MIVIAGVGRTIFDRRKDNSHFRDWVGTAFEEALVMSGLARSELDALVVASESDFFSLQLNPGVVLASDLGLVGLPCQRVEGGGASGHLALQAGVAMIGSGQARRVAVVGFEATASGLPAEQVVRLYGMSFDAWTEGMSEIPPVALYALSAKAFMQRTGATLSDFTQIAVLNRQYAEANPLSRPLPAPSYDEVMESPALYDPYRKFDCSPLSDGAAAIILAEENAIPAARATRSASIAGCGNATAAARLGDRPDPGFFQAKQRAAQIAYSRAGIDRPHQAIGLAEVYDSFSGAQLQALEVLGLMSDANTLLHEHREGYFARGGSLPVNLSGGLLGQGTVPGATGLAQIGACALQLEGCYHPGLQVDHAPRYALADTHGGIASVCAVTVIEKPRGDRP